MADAKDDADDDFLLEMVVEDLRKASPTPEGLTVEVCRRGKETWVQEIGGNGFVVYEYPVSVARTDDTAGDVITPLERLHDLEERCERMAGEEARPIDFPI